MTSLLQPLLWPILVLMAAPATRSADSPVPTIPDLAAAPLATVLGIDEANQLTVQQPDGSQRQVRLACLRAASGDARQAAMVFLRNFLVGERVWLVPAVAGSDGEAPSYVYRFPDGLFVNLEAVRQGYADAAAEPGASAATANAIAYWRDQARHTNKGIWTVAAAVRPATSQPVARRVAVAPTLQAKSDDRTGMNAAGEDAATVYVSSSSSGKKYHRADCRSLRNGGKAILLEQARKSYEPCKVCKPPQ